MENFFCRCETINTGGYATLFRSGFKTSPRTQSLCWTETSNPRNIPDIPAAGRLSPP